MTKVSERKARPAGVNEDGSYEKTKRKWYAPWKKYTVKYDRQGDVIPEDGAKVTPEDWWVQSFSLDTCTALTLLLSRIFPTLDNRRHAHPAGLAISKNRLDTDVAQGLTDAQVEERRKIMGFNELES